MLRRSRHAAAVLSLASTLLVCLGGSAQAHKPPARTAVPGPLGGINLPGLKSDSTPQQAEGEVSSVLPLHVKAIRIELPWAIMQPLGPGTIAPEALGYLDRLTERAAEHHLTVIALIDGTPCWASSAPADLLATCGPGAISSASSWPPSQPSAFGALVGQLVSRYGEKLPAIEVWNEPDQANEDYFAGPEKPRRYAELLRAAYTAAKQANPRVKVLAGSLVGSDGTFLRRLYAAGIKGYYDGLAVHFYSLTLASLREIRAVQLTNGDQTPLWLDEFGWTSCYPRERIQEEQACVTPGVQAQNITNMYRSLSRTSWVATDTIYKLRDSSGNDAGMITVSGARKPAFDALSRVLLAPRRSPAKVTLALRLAGGRIVASGSAPVGDYMLLEATRGALRFRAKFALDRFNRYSLTLPGALGTRGVHVRVYQEWTGPSGATKRST